MGILDGACGYLSGPMEFVADHGVQWRRKFIQLVRKANLDIDLIDPTNKPGGREVRIGEDKPFQQELQKTGQFRKLQEYVKKYRHFDLRFTDISDFLIAVIDPRVPQWGTSNEVYVAELQHKPCFFICDGGLYDLPRWLFDVIEKIEHDDPKRALEQTNVYQSVEEVVAELQLLDQGMNPLSDEWVLVRRAIEERRQSKTY